MSRLVIAALLGCFLASEPSLETRYPTGRVLRVEAETELSLEVTSMEVLVNGEPREGRGGDSSSELKRRVVTLDEVVQAEDGRPTVVHRTFRTVEGTGHLSFGDNSAENEEESPLEGVKLEITADGVEVLDGPEPDDAALEGHRLVLALDAFLPSGEVAAGAEWELDGEAIARGLALDVEQALFPRQQRAVEDEGGGRGRRGAPRGGGGPMTRLLHEAEWDGKATLTAESQDFEGTPCAVISIEIEGSGSLPEREPSGGGGRRGRALELGASGAVENAFEIELEGKLYFALDAARPARLELEGRMSTETHVERGGGDRSIEMSTTQEGTFRYVVVVTETADSDDDEK